MRSLEAKNRSQATISAYRTDLLQFVIWLMENNYAAVSPERIEKLDITEYLASLSRHGLSGVARARKLAAVREYFRYLVEHGIIDRSPAEGIQTPKKEKHSRGSLQPAEYDQLLSLAGCNPRDFAILQEFLQMGIRVSELVSLALSDIDLRERVLSVRQGKGGVERSIELEEKVVQALKSYLAVRPESGEDMLFLNKYGERAMISPWGSEGPSCTVTMPTRSSAPLITTGWKPPRSAISSAMRLKIASSFLLSGR